MKEKINLQELTALLSDKAGISKKEADIFLREFFGLMTEALVEDKLVKIRNLGAFKLSEVEARESIDVRNGNRLVIPAHTKVSYTPDKELNEIINEPYLHLKPIIIGNNPQKEKSDEHIEIQENEFTDEIIRVKKKGAKTFIFTFLIVAGLIAGFYFLSKETEDTANFHSIPTKTAFDIAKEKENNAENSDEFEKTEEVIDTVDTVIPVKEIQDIGKKRRTKVGERLTLISLEEYGDVVFWIYIYEENKHLISKDNYVKAGVDIIIPPPEKYGIDAQNPESLQKARDFVKNTDEAN